MPRVLAYIDHRGGMADDAAAELIAAARKIDAAAAPVAVVAGWGDELDAVCANLRSLYAEVWKVAGAALVYPNAELVRKALVAVIPRGSILLLQHNHFGMDLAPGLSIKLDAAFVPDVVDIQACDGASMQAVRQEFGGQVSAHVRCDLSSGAVISLRPGAFKPVEAAAAGGQVIDKLSETGPLTAGRRYLETVAAESGDVDIGKHQVLVSIGRGIQDKENVAVAEALAEALGGAVSCSRPVVYAKWMDKSRQVGSSGKSVKPKVYLACGISGSFQHIAGIKGNPFIVAINKNPKAPIFRVADVGIVADILEFLPELTLRIREGVPVAEGRGA
jgi:electron transfer flavoprotein alpha subunit